MCFYEIILSGTIIDLSDFCSLDKIYMNLNQNKETEDVMKLFTTIFIILLTLAIVTSLFAMDAKKTMATSESYFDVATGHRYKLDIAIPCAANSCSQFLSISLLSP